MRPQGFDSKLESDTRHEEQRCRWHAKLTSSIYGTSSTGGGLKGGENTQHRRSLTPRLFTALSKSRGTREDSSSLDPPILQGSSIQTNLA